MTGRAAAALAALVAALGGCGDEGGVLVEVTQAAAITEPIKTLHLFVGTPDDATGDFTGVAVPDDVIALGQPLAERPHTIRLVRSAGMTAETGLRVAVIGKHDGRALGLAWLDVGGIPDEATLRFPLELQPVGDVLTTATGCLVLPDGTLVGAVDDRDCDAVTVAAGDCDDLDAAVNPAVYDGCDGDGLGVDNDCNGIEDDGDGDGDGATCGSDCDDADPMRAPGLTDRCDPGDQIDNDCDLDVDEGVAEICGDQIDNDCDETTSDQGLDDEICGDGADNDCDLAVDEGRTDDLGVLVVDVDADGAACPVDCDDDNADIRPGAVEACNQDDDDCDGATDEEANDDGDPARCLVDCDDGDPTRYPGNPEVCDTVDNDCVPATHPAPSPCFASDGLGCEYGFRACNETLGAHEPLCTAETDTPQSAGVCSQFMSCAIATGDRLACGGEPTHLCNQAVRSTTGEVCDGATRALTSPDVGDDVCSWQIIGGRVQQGWTVSLLAQGSTVPSVSAATCQASFGVDAVPPGLQPGTFAVLLLRNGVYDHVEVFAIRPTAETVCPLPSLACTLAE